MRSKKQKGSVDKNTPKQKELERTVSLLRVELTRTEKALTKTKNRADRWHNEARAQKKSATRARARVKKQRQKLDEASATPEPVLPAALTEAAAPSQPLAEATTDHAVTVPNETWSVVQLRAEARARGLTGMSSKTKAQLLAALS